MGRLGRCVLPIHGEVGKMCPPHSWGGWGEVSSPFMGRLGRCVLPIHGEVARSAGGAGPPHLWGGGAKRRRGWSISPIPPRKPKSPPAPDPSARACREGARRGS